MLVNPPKLSTIPLKIPKFLTVFFFSLHSLAHFGRMYQVNSCVCIWCNGLFHFPSTLFFLCLFFGHTLASLFVILIRSRRNNKLWKIAMVCLFCSHTFFFCSIYLVLAKSFPVHISFYSSNAFTRYSTQQHWIVGNAYACVCTLYVNKKN